MSSNTTIRYNRQLFVNKVNELEGYVKRLKEHLSTIEGYRSQVASSWGDEIGREYVRLLDTQILKVKDAQYRLEDAIATFNKAIGEFDAQLELNKGTVEDIERLTAGFDVTGS